MLLVEELANIFGRNFSHSIDVFGNGNDRLVNPSRGGAWLGAQRRTKSAGGAEEDEAFDLIAEFGCFL